MSDFKILVDAVVNIDQITEQLKKKIANVEIKLKADGRTLRSSLEDNLTKGARSAGDAIQKELQKRVSDIKFTADTQGFSKALSKIKAQMADTKDTLTLMSWGEGNKADEAPLKKYYSRLASMHETYVRKVSKQEADMLAQSNGYNNAMEQRRIKTSQVADETSRLADEARQLHSIENQAKTTYTSGGTVNTEKANSFVNRQAQIAQDQMKAVLASGKSATSQEYLMYEDHYIRLLSMRQRYGDKISSMNKETTMRIAKDINAQFNGGHITADQATEEIQKLISKYQLLAAQAQVKLNTRNFSDLTQKEREAVMVTQQLQGELKKYSKTTQDAALSNNSFTKTLTQFISLRFIVYALWQAFKDGLITLQEIDDTLVGIRKVTDMSAESAQKLAQHASGVVSGFGRTVQDYLKAYETFAKAGFAEGQIESFTKLSLLLQNVGDVTAETANETLIAANVGFKMNGSYEKLSHTIDSMNNISNNNATTVSKMSEAIKASATVAQTAGFSFDEYISLVGAATTATQREGSEIGRAMRTIVANIRQVNDAEAEVDSETWGKAGKALLDIANIDLKDSHGEIRDTMTVITELAEKWDDLNSLQQEQLAGSIAGKRQLDIFKGLMENWNMVEKQLGEAANSTGSAIKENEIYLDSISAKMATFKNAVVSMWQNTIDSDQFKNLVEVGTSLIGVIEKLGIANIATIFMLGQLASKTTLIHKGFVGLIAPLTTLIRGFPDLKDGFTLAKGAGEGFFKTLKAGSLHTGEAASALNILKTIGVMALATAFLFLYNSIKQAYAAIEEGKDKAESTAETLTDTTASIEELGEKYRELYNTENRTAEQNQELGRIQGELNKKLDEAKKSVKGYVDAQLPAPAAIGDTAKAVDGQTSSLEKNKIAIEETTKALNKKWQEENAFAIESAKNTLNAPIIDESSNMDIWQRMGSALDDASKKINSSLLVLTDNKYVTAGEVIGMTYEELAVKLRKAIAAEKEKIESGQKSTTNLKLYSDALTHVNGKLESANKIIKKNNDIQNKGNVGLLAQEQTEYYNNLERTLKTVIANTDQQDAWNTSLKNGKDIIEIISDRAQVLADAYYTLSQNEKLSGQQISSLIEKYPTLISYYDQKNNTLNVTKKILSEMIDAEIVSAKIAVTAAADRLLASKTMASGALANYEKQVRGLMALSEAEIKAAAVMAGFAAQAQAFEAGGSWNDARAAGNTASKAALGDLRVYNESISTLVGLQSQLRSGMSGTTKPEKEKAAKKDTGKSAAEEAAELAANKAEAYFEKIRNDIEESFNDGAISAKEALARITKEIGSMASKYDQIKNKTSDTWTEMEKTIVSHYENLIGMQEDFTDKVVEDYEDAIEKVEDLQDKIVDALTTKYEEQRDAAIKALEEEHNLQTKYFDERIKQLEKEKEAINDTHEQDEANLITLKKKLELSMLDTSAMGKKRTAELTAQVADTQDKVDTRHKDDEIEALQNEQEKQDEIFEDKLESINTFYENLLSEAGLFAEANKLILGNNMKDIVSLFEEYAPEFSGIGQLLGKTMAEEITKEVTAGLNAIGTVNSGTAPIGTSYNPLSPSVSGTGIPTPSSSPTPSGAIPWTGVVYKRGSSGTNVKRIQNNLIASGHSVGSAGADGSFGSATDSAVKAFQKANGLTADGIVGKNTWNKLVKFHSGGVPVMNTLASGRNEGLAIVKGDERILSSKQTSAFDDFVYNGLPRFSKLLENIKANPQQIFNDKLVQVDMNVTNNTPFDIQNNNDNLARAIKRALMDLGMKF